MKIFVASSFLNKDEVRMVENGLRSAGFEVTSRWVDHDGSNDPDVLKEQSIIDATDIHSANVFVLVWPGRWSSTTELGIALGANKRVYVIDGNGFDKNCNLYFHHPCVRIVHSVSGLIFNINLDILMRTIGKDQNEGCKNCQQNST